MPKKVKGQNAFYFFMLDFKQREERAGRTFPNGLKDVQVDPKCSEQWKNLPGQERGHYEALAKKDRVTSQGKFVKLTTDGTPLSVWDAKQKMESDFEQSMLSYIDSIVSMGFEHNNLGKLKFLFIHANWFYIIVNGNENDYYPAEFAVCEFSLDEGIGESYHEIVRAEIPMGYNREAIENSKKYHQIPKEFPEGESDFSVMYNRLADLLKPHMTGSTFPPMYIVNRAKGPAQSLLNRLASAADKEPSIFRLYSLETLFMHLQNAVYQNSDGTHIRLTTAAYELERDPFCYERGLACKYHDNTDGTSQFCSLSIVKRWGFTLADYCCEGLGIEMIPGVHCPKKLTAEEINVLNDSMYNLNFYPTAQVVSMTGVGMNYRETVSKTRFKRQEQRPIDDSIRIIDHSKTESSRNTVAANVPPPPERPLRTPKTMSYAMKGMANTTVPSLTEEDFPSLGGRGKYLKARSKESRTNSSRGHGDSMNK